MSRPLTPVVAGSGLMLVTSAPVRPGLRQAVGGSGCNDEDGEQAADLAVGQGNHPGGCGPVGVLGRGDLLRAIKTRGPDARVADAMTTELPTIGHRRCLEDAFKLLMQKQAPAVGVTDASGKLVGLTGAI